MKYLLSLLVCLVLFAMSSVASAQSWVAGYDFSRGRWYAAPAQPAPYYSPYGGYYYSPYYNPYQPRVYYGGRDCDRDHYRHRDYRRHDHRGHDHRDRGHRGHRGHGRGR